MSYCRFSEGDIYLYASTAGGWECCGCCLQDGLRFVHLDSLEEVKAHLEAHIAAGHDVPERALRRVSRELEEQQNENASDVIGE